MCRIEYVGKTIELVGEAELLSLTWRKQGITYRKQIILDQE